MALSKLVAQLAPTGCTGKLQYCQKDTSCVEVSRPLYCLKYFKDYVSTGNWKLFNHIRTRGHMDDLDWNYDDLKIFLMNLDISKCRIKKHFDMIIANVPGHDSVDCDSYCVQWNEIDKKCVSQEGEGVINLYVKIAVIVDSNGTLSGVVSFHQ